MTSCFIRAPLHSQSSGCSAHVFFFSKLISAFSSTGSKLRDCWLSEDEAAAADEPSSAKEMLKFSGIWHYLRIKSYSERSLVSLPTAVAAAPSPAAVASRRLTRTTTDTESSSPTAPPSGAADAAAALPKDMFM